jgi:hypothetical protein
MQFWLALAVSVVTVLNTWAAAAQQCPYGYWCWCETARAYYPYVTGCSVPWRPVLPRPYGPVQQQVPGPSLPAQSFPPPVSAAAEPTDAYREGAAAWRTLQAWFDSQTGDRRAGADYWAAKRNVAGHQTCADAGNHYPKDQNAFVSGCLEAARQLDPIDVRRNSQPDYKEGFADASQGVPIASKPDTPAVSSAGSSAQVPTPEGLVQCPPSRIDERVQTVNGTYFCRPSSLAAKPEPASPAPSGGYGGYVQNHPSTPIISDSPPPPRSAPTYAPSAVPIATVATGAIGGGILALIAVALAGYFLPTIIALMRHHHNTLAIFLLNLLLGWSFLGWVIALVWSATAVERRPAPRF